MDRNKLNTLRQINYRIGPSCGECIWGEFPQNEWGTCGVWTYQHEKHTGEKRHLSIHKTGSCSEFERTDAAHLSHFAEFIDDPK